MAQAKTSALFVGANNVTGEVELDSLRAILETYFNGYTILPSTGMWKGTSENSVVVLISNGGREDDAFNVAIKSAIDAIKVNLEQQSVGYMELPAMSFL